MIDSVEQMRTDCKAAYEAYEKQLLEFAKEYPDEILKIKNWEKLQYTIDEKYFQIRRKFNGKLNQIYFKYSRKPFVAELDDDEDRYYHICLKNIESNYMKEAVILERSLIGHD